MQKVCIIIPCYNEESRLDFDVFRDFLGSNPNVDFIFVNDGSRDNTLARINKFSLNYPERISCHDMLQNSGKAEAVRAGMLISAVTGRYKYLGFWDADLATPLSEIPHFVRSAELLQKQMVIGSRMKRLGAEVSRKGSRHFLGRVFSTFASWILKLPVYDTQCGAKIFDVSLIYLFEKPFGTKWLFDIELLARYRNKVGLEQVTKTVLEFPVNKWEEKSGSKLKFGHMIKVPLELIQISKKYNL